VGELRADEAAEPAAEAEMLGMPLWCPAPAAEGERDGTASMLLLWLLACRVYPGPTLLALNVCACPRAGPALLVLALSGW